jgi:hypothetical protein
VHRVDKPRVQLVDGTQVSAHQVWRQLTLRERALLAGRYYRQALVYGLQSSGDRCRDFFESVRGGFWSE